MAKKQLSKFLTGLLAVVMMLSLVPVSLYVTAFAAEVEQYSVVVVDEANQPITESVTITLTDKADDSKTETQTTENGVAVFQNFVEENATYIVSVSHVIGYEDVSDYELSVAEGDAETTLRLTTLEKVTISGTVIDDTGSLYNGAKVFLTGYSSANAETGTDGAFSFEVFKGQDYTLTVEAKEYNTESIEIKAIAADRVVPIAFSSVKKFLLNTNAGEKGTITATENDVRYGESRTITATADTGYCIDSFVVNGESLAGAKGEKSFDYVIGSVEKDYNISVSFIRKTYKITFTVGENGDVTYDDGAQKVPGGSVNVDKVFNESTDPNSPTKVNVKAVPADNYRVSSIIIDNGDPEEFDENNKEYSKEFDMTSDHSFVVEFKLNTFSVTIENEKNGTATIDKAKVDYDGTSIITIKPNDGFNIESVTVDDVATTDYEITNNGIYELKVSEIKKDTVVKVSYSEIETIDMDDKVVSFNSSDAIVFDDSDTNIIKYVFANDAEVKFSTGNYQGITINGNGSFDVSSFTVSDSEIVSEIMVYNALKWYKVKLDKKIQIVIDKTAPEVKPEHTMFGWTNADKVTISGSVSDENTEKNPSSGLNYVVWNKGVALTDEQILAESVKKISISADGFFSFESEEGEQVSVYYIYAVDISGNISKGAEVKVGIDKKAPEITSFTFSTEENNVIQDAIKFLSFGIFCNEKIYVTVSATDEEISSGLKEIELYNGGEKPIATKKVTGNSATFELTEKYFDGKEISAKIIDNAGNSSAKTPTDTGGVLSNYVKITTVKPTVEFTTSSAKYTQDGKLWYDGNTVVTVKVSDEESKAGIYSVSIKLNGVELEKDINNKEINTLFYKNHTDAETFEINTSQNPVDGENTIEVSVINNAGMKSETATQKVYIDTKKPQVSNFEIKKVVHGDVVSKVINFLTFGIFCNEQVEITVTATDEAATSGIKEITLYADSEKIATVPVNSDGKSTFVIPTDEIVGENKVFDKVISATATDNVDNVTEHKVQPTEVNSNIKSSSLMIETVKPVISQIQDSILDSSVRNDGKTYSGDIKLEFTAQDKDAGLANVDIRINDVSIAGYPVDYTNNEVAKRDIQTYGFTTEGIEPNEDGEYRISVIVIDNAGNVQQTSTIVKKDQTSPVINSFEFTSEDKNVPLETVATQEEYGYYFKKDTIVKIAAKDERSKFETVSGVDSITVVLHDKDGKYYTVNPDGDIIPIDKDKIKDAQKHDTKDNSYEFTIKSSFKGQIFALATDKVGNTPNNSTFDNSSSSIVKEDPLVGFKYPNGSILETEDKHEEEQNHIVFDKEATEYKTSNDGELYSKDVPVEIIVTDTYSGIRSIEWSVKAPCDTDNNQEEKITIENSGTEVTIGNADKPIPIANSDWEVMSRDKNLVTQVKKTITVSNNSNDIVVYVEMTDRAGNTSVKDITFSIDKTSPEIDVAYTASNGTQDVDFTNGFHIGNNQNCKAVITITELNFSNEDVEITLTRDGEELRIEPDFQRVVDGGEDKDHHQIKWFMDIDYADFVTEDGNIFNFDIKCKDKVGRENNAVNYGDYENPQEFIIDNTKPTISVTITNSDVHNGKYFNADRIATVVIKERFFDENIGFDWGGLTYSLNGTSGSAPTPVLEDSDDKTFIRVYKIAFSAEGDYTFDVGYTDLSGNEAEPFSCSSVSYAEFTIDKTAPELIISGVEDMSANNDTVAPIVSYSDINFDESSVSVVLTGVNLGTVDYQRYINNQLQEGTVSYDDFERVQSVDDIYTLTATLTDLAGNVTTKSITFSANRFGSTYDIKSLENIIGKYLQNEEDIVFTEINVDSLNKGETKIKLTKNGTPMDLVEGTDYTITETGGNGQWSQYKYTIKKALFADDGRYSISVYSVDAAGNINENIDETKKAEISFGVDKTKPVIVPIDFESDTQYPVEVKTVSVEIKDNLVLEGVKIYLNGSEIEYSNDGETYTFDIPEKNEKQNVRIVAVDAAGNEYELSVENFLVSTNLFVRWFNNTPLFIGSIAGVVVLFGAIILLVMAKRKKTSK